MAGTDLVTTRGIVRVTPFADPLPIPPLPDDAVGGDYGGGSEEAEGGDFGDSGDTTPQPTNSTSGNGAPQLFGNWTPALFMPYKRSIGGIIAQITVEENATDDLTITEHPVEQGAPIADHSFKRPSTVTIRAAWSVAGAYDLSAESGVYGLLLSWQAALLPFDVVTGKRRYTNMLMERLTVVTDQKSEYALMADIVCRQVIIVGTQTAKADASQQKDAEKTAGEKSGGTAEPTSKGSGEHLDDIQVETGTMPGVTDLNRERSADDLGETRTPAVTADARRLEVTASANTSAPRMREVGLTPVNTPIPGGVPGTTGVTVPIPKSRAARVQEQSLELYRQRKQRALQWQTISKSLRNLDAPFQSAYRS